MKHILLILLGFVCLPSFGQNSANEHDPKLIGKWEFNKVEITFKSDREREAFSDSFYFVFFEDGNQMLVTEEAQRVDKWHTVRKDMLKMENSEGTNYSLVTDDILLLGWENTLFSLKRVKCNWKKEQVLLDTALVAYEAAKQRRLARERAARYDYSDIGLDEYEEEEPEERDEVYEIFDVSEKAEFPGGEDSLQRFVYDNLVYPSLAKQNNAEGTVTVMFVINEIGEIQDVTVVTSLGQGLDQEAVRLIKKTSGLWKPAKQRDKPVSMRFRMPIKFELPN